MEFEPSSINLSADGELSAIEGVYSLSAETGGSRVRQVSAAHHTCPFPCRRRKCANSRRLNRGGQRLQCDLARTLRWLARLGQVGPLLKRKSYFGIRPGSIVAPNPT
jgi:hypothetical protein